MSEQLTEAAKLYWENLDVLGPARRELVAYLDATFEHWWQRVELRWQQESGFGHDGKLKCWTRREDPGRWSVYLEPSETGLEVQLSDPRRSGEVNHYKLALVITQQHRKELDKIGEEAFEMLKQLAAESEIELGISDDLELTDDHVEFLTDGASELGDLVADALLERLKIIAKFDDWLKSR